MISKVTNDSHPGEANFHDHHPEHLAELGVCQGEGPEAEVGGRVGHTAQGELYRVDGLVDEHLTKVMQNSEMWLGG